MSEQSSDGIDRDYMTTVAHHICHEKDRETLAVDDSNDKLRCVECGRFCKVATATDHQEDHE